MVSWSRWARPPRCSSPPSSPGSTATRSTSTRWPATWWSSPPRGPGRGAGPRRGRCCSRSGGPSGPGPSREAHHTVGTAASAVRAGSAVTSTPDRVSA
ncbi:hypothetical protein [Ornithinimicrobium kibberense]|uniref:hypothetical protein n=1 Tax=Ornithinimicrobium kibberense TaxID=282060 RepID=UPI00361ACF29